MILRTLGRLVGKFCQNFYWAFYKFKVENRADLTADDWVRTVSIAAERVGPKIKKFSEIDRDRLIANGRLATQEFLKTKGLSKK